MRETLSTSIFFILNHVSAVRQVQARASAFWVGCGSGLLSLNYRQSWIVWCGYCSQSLRKRTKCSISLFSLSRSIFQRKHLFVGVPPVFTICQFSSLTILSEPRHANDHKHRSQYELRLRIGFSFSLGWWPLVPCNADWHLTTKYSPKLRLSVLRCFPQEWIFAVILTPSPQWIILNYSLDIVNV